MTTLSPAALEDLKTYVSQNEERKDREEESRQRAPVLSKEELIGQIEDHGVSVLVFDTDSNLARLETQDWVICIRTMNDCTIIQYRNPDSFDVSEDIKKQIREVAERVQFAPMEYERGGALHRELSFQRIQLRREPLVPLFRKRLWRCMHWTD